MGVRMKLALFLILILSVGCTGSKGRTLSLKNFGTTSEFKAKVPKVPLPTPAPAPTPAPQPEIPKGVDLNRNYSDEVYAGYQGWFATPGDGFSNSWFHWKDGNISHVDLLPDVSIYPPSVLVSAPFNNGYKLFPSTSPIVVDTHTELIAKGGIDGFALQRFATNDLNTRNDWFFKHKNRVAELVKTSAEKWGTKYYLQYDISGGPANWATMIKNDFTDIIKGQIHFLDSPNYARQDGRPVVCLWGIGIADRPGTPEETLDLIQWFKTQHGVFVVGGLAGDWRASGGNTKPGFLDTYLALDAIEPWLIGAFDNSSVSSFYTNVVDPDITFIKNYNSMHGKNILYKTTIWSGFSWHNMHRAINIYQPLNHVPRNGGQFLWKQAQLNAARGLKSYVAMFDEYDEGTAIAPTVNNKSLIPVETTFLTLDADGINMTSDFYVRLSGEITHVLRNKKVMSSFTTNLMGPSIALNYLGGSAPTPTPTPAPAPAPAPTPAPVPSTGTTRSIQAGSLILNTWDRISTSNIDLVMQSDGNLVIYRGSTPLWNSRTGHGTAEWCENQCMAAFQGDGNLVLYKNSQPYWSTGTHGADDRSKTLVIGGTDSIIKILNGSGSIIWRE